MNIDERLEALTQTVELLASMHKDNEQREQKQDQRLEKLIERHEALTQSVEMLTSDVRGLHSLVAEIAEGTARLLHVAEVHEQRIGRLEQQS